LASKRAAVADASARVVEGSSGRAAASMGPVVNAVLRIDGLVPWFIGLFARRMKAAAPAVAT
jgi:hypothetical protein